MCFNLIGFCEMIVVDLHNSIYEGLTNCGQLYISKQCRTYIKFLISMERNQAELSNIRNDREPQLLVVVTRLHVLVYQATLQSNSY